VVSVRYVNWVFILGAAIGFALGVVTTIDGSEVGIWVGGFVAGLLADLAISHAGLLARVRHH